MNQLKHGAQYPNQHKNQQGHQFENQDALAAQFNLLDKLLEQSRPLWQVRAFEARELPWQAQFPRLAACLWALDDDILDALDAEQSVLVDALSPALKQDLRDLDLHWDLSLLTQSLSCEPSLCKELATSSSAIEFTELAHFSAHIKGRKWEQITAFVQHLPDSGLPVLEWCAGKGHLGRLIAKSRGVDVLSLEWQAMLCEEGQAFADKWQLSQRFICADAFTIHSKLHQPESTFDNPYLASDQNEGAVNPFKRQQQAVALHACGDLHVRLLQLAAAAGTQALAISPCCYHLIQASHYQGLSCLAKRSALNLSRHDLQLPLQQSLIASPKQQALRHQEIAWRLGFDALQRHCRGVDAYLPLPSIKQSQLSGHFTDFCRWAAQQKAVDLPVDTDFEVWLEIGLQRQRLTRRIDLAAHLFRRALEQWLILDRCSFLQENGYRVTVEEFCANSVTPRNALILAEKAMN